MHHEKNEYIIVKILKIKNQTIAKCHNFSQDLEYCYNCGQSQFWVKTDLWVACKEHLRVNYPTSVILTTISEISLKLLKNKNKESPT